MNASGPSLLGQLLVVKLDEGRWSTALERMLERHCPAGVFLSRLRTPESTADLAARIARTLDTSPLLWLEEEGGDAGPLSAFFPSLPLPIAVAERGRSAIERLGELLGAGIRLLGFNTNCAPTLDLATHAESGGHTAPPTFGADPHQAARAGAAFVRGMARHHILACGKHFPGFSNARACVVGKPMTRLWHEDLIPYRELVTRLPLVMVSNAAYKAYDFDILRAAAESTSILRGLLRLKLRYQGLAVSDLTRTPESDHALELANRVVRSISAGCDLVIIPGDEKDVAAALVALERASQSGKLEVGRIGETFARLRHATERLARPAGKVRKGEVERLAEEFEEFRRSFTLGKADRGAVGSGR